MNNSFSQDLQLVFTKKDLQLISITNYTTFKMSGDVFFSFFISHFWSLFGFSWVWEIKIYKVFKLMSESFLCVGFEACVSLWSPIFFFFL